VLLALLAVTATSAASPTGDPWQWRWAIGAQLDAASHGVLDVGVRRGPWSLELFTDTVDVRYAPNTAGGRYWLGIRGQLFAAQLLSSPWTAGAPDPSRRITARSIGFDAGWIRYFRSGVYGGAALAARQYAFAAQEQTTIEVEGGTFVGGPSLIAGLYRRDLFRAEVSAGFDIRSVGVSPRVQLEAVLLPRGTLAPRLELRAGAAEEQDDVTTTRLGGLNPYVVPLAGAGWAEFWVEDYVAVRAGPVVRGDWGELSLVVDGALFDGRGAFGLGAISVIALKWFDVEGSVGWAPKIERQPDVGRIVGWIRLVRGWEGF
jgi:hypothetical protein